MLDSEEAQGSPRSGRSRSPAHTLMAASSQLAGQKPSTGRGKPEDVTGPPISNNRSLLSCLASHHWCSRAVTWLTRVFSPVQRDMDTHAQSQCSSHLLPRCNLFICKQEILRQASPLPGQHFPLTWGAGDSTAARQYSWTSKKLSFVGPTQHLHIRYCPPHLYNQSSCAPVLSWPQSSGSVQREG